MKTFKNYTKLIIVLRELAAINAVRENERLEKWNTK